MGDELKPMPLRLAIRERGDMVSAYLAKPDTMDDAVLIGSIGRGIAVNNQDLYERWQAIMREALSRGIVAVIGQKPTLVEQPAPDHERQH